MEWTDGHEIKKTKFQFERFSLTLTLSRWERGRSRRSPKRKRQKVSKNLLSVIQAI
jgi:hypothetical protein